DLLSLNLYTYCANKPLIYHDPSGHFLKELWHKLTKPFRNDKKVKKEPQKNSTKVNGGNKKNNSTSSNSKKTYIALSKTTPEEVQKQIINGSKKSALSTECIASSNSKSSLVSKVAKESIVGTSDAVIGTYINSLPETSTKRIKIPRLGPAMEVETSITRTGTKALKGASKIAGPASAAAYGYDVYSDVKKYDGKNAVKAIIVTTTGAIVTIGLTALIGTTTAPAAIVIGVGALIGVGVGYAGDKLKDRFIG
ncbi:MAG: hypothetical protein RSE93_04125, partial [Oscillospiraceae bacterium]